MSRDPKMDKAVDWMPDGVGSNVDTENDSRPQSEDYKPPYSPEFIRQMEETLGVKLKV